METILSAGPRADARRDMVRRWAAIAIAIGIATMAIVAMAALMRPATHPIAAPAQAFRPPVVRPPVLPPPPPVPPMVLADLTPDQARASNAALPYLGGKIEASRPFVYTGSPADRTNALVCLTAAVLYEAGDDAVGEQAVAQVVTNRVRHPAFPKTICGVVFQGSERSTGCQFTFTCDGALDRPPRAIAWTRARSIADAALSGHVEKAVGTATHYHTDWVVPYWRDSLAKLAKVHTQIFYRWSGWWGTPPAFVGRIQPLERLDPRLVALAGPELAAVADTPGDAPPSPSDLAVGDAAPPPPRKVLSMPGVSAADLRGGILRLADTEAGQYVVQLPPATEADVYPRIAAALCVGRADCLVWGWLTGDMMPRTLPFGPHGLRGLTFVYRRSSVLGATLASWNCRQAPRADRKQCLPGID